MRIRPLPGALLTRADLVAYLQRETRRMGDAVELRAALFEDAQRRPTSGGVWDSSVSFSLSDPMAPRVDVAHQIGARYFVLTSPPERDSQRRHRAALVAYISGGRWDEPTP